MFDKKQIQKKAWIAALAAGDYVKAPFVVVDEENKKRKWYDGKVKEVVTEEKKFFVLFFCRCQS